MILKYKLSLKFGNKVFHFFNYKVCGVIKKMEVLKGKFQALFTFFFCKMCLFPCWFMGVCKRELTKEYFVY